MNKLSTYGGEAKLDSLKGKIVKKIYMNYEFLKFETDLGDYVFGVSGDCCSSSYFYDFYGVKNLIGGRIIDIQIVDIDSEKAEREAKAKSILENGYNSIDSLACYGYQFTTHSEEFGDVTSVFSFRNESNGYYGGSLEDRSNDTLVEPEITEDVTEIKIP